MTNQKLLDMLHEVFPDETVQTGQRLRVRQVETINAIVVELKRRQDGVKALRKSATP
jgi:hypothetical protein